MPSPLLALAKPLTVACILQAASMQNLPAMLLFGLLKTEGGKVGAWTTNTNGSHDLGPMQINDQTWLTKIADMQFGGSRPAAAAELVYDGCYNVRVGAWIFRRYLNEAGGNFGVAVGYYNSHNEIYADQYRRRFLHSLEQLLGSGQTVSAKPPTVQADGPPPIYVSPLKHSSSVLADNAGVTNGK